MSRRVTSKQSRQVSGTGRRTQIVIAVLVALSLFAVWTMLAYSGSRKPAIAQNKSSAESLSPESLNSSSPVQGVHLCGQQTASH